MCDIMEKDVLIELVAYAQATLGQRLPLEVTNEDEIYLANLRADIYSSFPEELDYIDISNTVKGIIKKYEHLPKII